MGFNLGEEGGVEFGLTIGESAVEQQAEAGFRGFP